MQTESKCRFYAKWKKIQNLYIYTDELISIDINNKSQQAELPLSNLVISKLN